MDHGRHCTCGWRIKAVRINDTGDPRARPPAPRAQRAYGGNDRIVRLEADCVLRDTNLNPWIVRFRMFSHSKWVDCVSMQHLPVFGTLSFFYEESGLPNTSVRSARLALQCLDDGEPRQSHGLNDESVVGLLAELGDDGLHQEGRL